MTAVIVNLRAVRATVHELEKLGTPEFRKQAIDCVVAEARSGRSGFAVSQHLWAERMRRRNPSASVPHA